MATVKLCCRLVSCYGKQRLASRTANAIVFTKHDHILKENMKLESLGVGMGTYGLLRCVQNISSRATSNEKGSKERFSSNDEDEDEDEDVYEYYQNAAKFAVEQHNHENGTQLMFLELGKDRLSEFSICLEHVSYIYLHLKVVDEKGKVEYVKADLTSRKGILESGPLVYLTNQMLRNCRATLSRCFSDDDNVRSIEQ